MQIFDQKKSNFNIQTNICFKIYYFELSQKIRPLSRTENFYSNSNGE